MAKLTPPRQTNFFQDWPPNLGRSIFFLELNRMDSVFSYFCSPSFFFFFFFCLEDDEDFFPFGHMAFTCVFFGGRLWWLPFPHSVVLFVSFILPPSSFPRLKGRIVPTKKKSFFSRSHGRTGKRTLVPLFHSRKQNRDSRSFLGFFFFSPFLRNVFSVTWHFTRFGLQRRRRPNLLRFFFLISEEGVLKTNPLLFPLLR